MITSIERTYAGAYQVSGFDATDHLVTRTYYGYTRREAIALFRQELKR